MARAVGYELLSSVVTMVGGIFLLVGLIIMTVGGAMLLRERALMRESTAVPATVTGTYAGTRRDSDGEHRAYQVEFKFLLPNGKSWTGLQDVSLDTWNRLRTGDPLTVLYDPRNPSRYVLPMDHSDWLPVFMVGFSALFVVLGATMLYFGAREIIGPLRLYRSGESVTGRVVDLEVVDNETFNDRHPTRVVYRFRDQSGAEFSGSAKTLDEEFLQSVDRESAVTVLYDRRHPTRNALFAAIGVPVAAADGVCDRQTAHLMSDGKNGRQPLTRDIKRNP